MERRRVGGLEVEILGVGEPVVVVQTSLTAGELRPLCEQPVRRAPYPLIHCHRRGYGESSPAPSPRSSATP